MNPNQRPIGSITLWPGPVLLRPSKMVEKAPGQNKSRGDLTMIPSLSPSIRHVRAQPLPATRSVPHHDRNRASNE